MTRRAQEAKQRPEVLAVLRESVELKRKVVKAWPDVKPWINETERELVAAKVRAGGGGGWGLWWGVYGVWWWWGGGVVVL
jgi:hypothetical protein